MNEINFSARCTGKSTFWAMQKELALNAGKTVLVYTKDGITKQKRIKHLTLIETIK